MGGGGGVGEVASEIRPTCRRDSPEEPCESLQQNVYESNRTSITQKKGRMSIRPTEG